MRRTPPVVVQLQPQPAVQAAVQFIALLVSGGLAARALRHQLRAAAALLLRLRWDGEAWWLAESGRFDDAGVQLEPLIDLGARWPLQFVGLTGAMCR